MHIQVYLIALAAILACGSASDSSVCNGQATYDYPRTDSCWRYQRCQTGSTTPQDAWCFPLIRSFSRTDLKCEWFWEVDCSAKPPPPPAPPTQAPTSQPPTPPPTQPPTPQPTQPPTPPPTQPPTPQPTQAPTKAPTQAPTKAPTQPPTQAPTAGPTEAPTQAPTKAPPTAAPAKKSWYDKAFGRIRDLVPHHKPS